jgi:hypothetical protein
MRQVSNFIDREAGSFDLLEPRPKGRSMGWQFQAPEVDFVSDRLFDYNPLNTRPQLSGANLLCPYNAKPAFIMLALQRNDFTGMERYTKSPQLRADRTDINRVGECSFLGTVVGALRAEAHRQDHLRPYITLFPSRLHRSTIGSELLTACRNRLVRLRLPLRQNQITDGHDLRG